MTKALIIRADYTKDYVDIDGYEDINKAVGGYIEAVNFGDKKYFCYINEEGKLLGLPENNLATQLWYDSGQTILLGDYIAGDAIFFGGIDKEGDDVDIDENFIDIFMKYD